MCIRDSNKTGSISDEDGSYSLVLPAGKELTIVFSHLSYQNQIHKIILNPNEERSFNITLVSEVTVITEVELVDDALRDENITSLDKKNLDIITGPSGGVEGLISTLAGVSTKNEMSSQYSVRGGNYDENLVYVNGFEIYRPFLVRSGEPVSYTHLRAHET